MTQYPEFSIPYYQYLDPEGNVVADLPPFAQSRDELLSLFHWMLLTRELDKRAVNLQRTGQLSTFPSSLGQEATTVGMGQALQPDDIYVPYYRDQGTLIQRGAKPWQIYAYWGGDERGSDFSTYREDFPIAVPISSQLLHAAGVGYAVKLRQEKRAVLTICGDGGTSEGDFYEAINFAGTFNLPVVFIILNNQWAISVPLSQQTGCKTLAQKAIAGGFSGIQVDGNDIIAVKHHVSEALNQAREFQKPFLIEAITYRLSDHTTADDARRYTPAGLLENAWKEEPIKRLEKYLKVKHHVSDSEIDALQLKCEQTIQQAVLEYQSLPQQKPTAMFDSLYAILPTAYKEQYQALQKKNNEPI